MIEDEDRTADDTSPPAANDNGNGDARIRIDAAVLTIARLIGRQMAREAFERLEAANDNEPPERCGDSQGPGDWQARLAPQPARQMDHDRSSRAAHRR